MLIHVLLAAHCSASCGRALAELFQILFRLVFHYWGFSGVMKAAGVGVASYGTIRMGVLLGRPPEQFHGTIRLVDDRFVIQS